MKNYEYLEEYFCYLSKDHNDAIPSCMSSCIYTQALVSYMGHPFKGGPCMKQMPVHLYPNEAFSYLPS